MTKMEFLKSMKKLSMSYLKDLKEEELEMWYDFFKEQDAETFYNAVNETIKKSKYFPSIAILNELCVEQQKKEYHAKLLQMKNDNILTEKDYDKLMMWLSEGIIPHWLKEQMNIKLIEN